MRIILADHHEQAQQAMKELLEECEIFECIGGAVYAQGLLRLAEDKAPDLVLVDRELLGSSILVLND